MGSIKRYVGIIAVTAVSAAAAVPATAATSQRNIVKTAAAAKVGANKTFTVNLSSATNAAIARSAASGTIVHPAKVSAKSTPIHINFQPASAATPRTAIHAFFMVPS